MKKILITGAQSYIGTSFETYMKQWIDDYHIETVDMLDGTWRSLDFKGYDTVFHVAGLAHKKRAEADKRDYFEVNCNLAVEAAEKAKKDHVCQFVFLSSMSVYGMDTGTISKDTIPKPRSDYGKSKKQAEDIIGSMETENFKVAILRPPMVYGKGCKGNFQSIVRLIQKSPIFPRIHNQRSMLYIDNLSAFVKILVDRSLNGLFFPQNKDYTDTSHMAVLIAKSLDKNIHLNMPAGLCMSFLRVFLPVAKKAFGSLVYDGVEEFDFAYNVIDFDSSILKSVSVQE